MGAMDTVSGLKKMYQEKKLVRMRAAGITMAGPVSRFLRSPSLVLAGWIGARASVCGAMTSSAVAACFCIRPIFSLATSFGLASVPSKDLDPSHGTSFDFFDERERVSGAGKDQVLVNPFCNRSRRSRSRLDIRVASVLDRTECHVLAIPNRSYDSNHARSDLLSRM